MIARLVRVTGRVQGVFFRAWTREQAERLRVAGWVRNCPDGTVEAHVEGEQEDVDRMIGLLYEGPSGARVDRVEAQVAELGHYDGFASRR